MIVAAVTATATAQAEVHPDELKLKPQIDQAIERGVEYLCEEQLRDGSWGLHGDYIGGRGGLVLYTLLQCGVSREHPAVQRAVAYLDGCDPDRTYATTCMILAYDALRDGREKRIAELVEKLLLWQKPGGDWGYPHAGPDLSCTQYAALGLYIGQKHGIDIDPSHFLDLLDSLEDYRGEVEKVANPKQDGRTGAAKVEMAGYRYRRHAENQPCTGSMTSAALAVMEICKAGLGRKLKRNVRRSIERNSDAAMVWMGKHFTANKNPFGGHHYYYLYGCERVGALMNTERFGEHWWYIDGARWLVDRQDKAKGNWGGVTDTCFALLFLRRATGGHAPTTGAGGTNTHSFAAGTAESDVRIRGAGQQPLSLWVDGFGEDLVDLHSDYGLRVVSVVYEDDQGQVLGKVAADPTKTWHQETFLYRDKAIARGTHKVRARVTLLANDCEPGQTDPVEVVSSDWMEVRIRDVLEPWMQTATNAYRENILRTQQAEVTVSSEWDRNPGAHLIDGFESRRWIAAEDDQAPTVTISWRKAQKVGRIMFTGLAQHDRDLGKFDGFALEFAVGNDRKRWTRVELPDDSLEPVLFELPKARKMRSIRLRFVDRVKRNGQLGLSEFALLPPAK
ncbi:MAG: discoidin domain-containing protein [Planctomycetes bacterium]|nr:discoidin domain-containing protein [Planctomycetota bacterium]